LLARRAQVKCSLDFIGHAPIKNLLDLPVKSGRMCKVRFLLLAFCFLIAAVNAGVLPFG
jgi:hypothetical protein